MKSARKFVSNKFSLGNRQEFGCSIELDVFSIFANLKGTAYNNRIRLKALNSYCCMEVKHSNLPRRSKITHIPLAVQVIFKNSIITH